jgi:PAS domain S-box-containing protein
LVNLPLNWKFFLVVLLPLLLMGMITTLTIEKSLDRHFHQEMSEDANAIGNTLAASTIYHLLENDRKGVRNLLDNAVNMDRELAYIYVTDPDHKLIAHTFSQAFPAASLKNPDILRTPEIDREIIHLPEGDFQEITIPLRGGTLGEIHLGFSEASYRKQIIHARNEVLYVTLAISLTGLAALLLLIRLITRPLANLTEAADQISQGRLEVKLSTSDDEFGQLAMAFNRMAEKLGNQLNRREEAEKNLRENENLYRTLVDNIDLGVIMINKDFEVLLANAGQGRLFKRPPKDFIGRKCYEIFGKRDKNCSICPGYKAMQSGLAEEAETVATLDDGTNLQVQIKAFPVRDEHREVSGCIEIVSDISTRKHMEDEMQRIKNLETIGQLAGGLAHDFNNLLTTLIGNIELAKSAIPQDNDALPRLDAAENACEQARRLTNQLLTFAKGGMPIKKITRLPELLNEACHFTLSGTNLHYVLNVPDHIWPVEIDANQMTQVIHNLMVNSKEAIRDNPAGKIFLVAENYVLGKDTNLPLPPGRYVKIAIADEGRGIKLEHLGKIFHPYFTTKSMGNSRGTGLGLTICHSIIHKHGGHITVNSEVNRGTTITIYLPAAESAQPPSVDYTQHPQVPTPKLPAKLRILLLEDEEEVAHIAIGYLVTLLHHCEVARTDQEALKMVKESLTAGQPYDLLILDLTIRGGLGGEEVLKRIRQLQSDVVAIVSSGYNGDPIMTNYREYGFQAALPKPFNLKSLRTAVEQATAST